MAVEPVSRLRVPLALAERIEEITGLLGAGYGWAPGLILDSCHCYPTGDGMAAAIRDYGARIAAVQLADMPRRIEPGAHPVAFAPIMAALDDTGCTGLVEAEFNPARLRKSGERGRSPDCVDSDLLDCRRAFRPAGAQTRSA